MYEKYKLLFNKFGNSILTIHEFDLMYSRYIVSKDSLYVENFSNVFHFYLYTLYFKDDIVIVDPIVTIYNNNEIILDVIYKIGVENNILGVVVNSYQVQVDIYTIKKYLDYLYKE